MTKEVSSPSRCVPSDCCHVSGNCQREDKTNCLEYGCQIYGDNELSAAYGRIRFLEAKQRSEIATPMNEERAKQLLDSDVRQDDDGLYSLGWYLGWSTGDKDAVLDGNFTADELEAIAWWMKNKGKPK